MQELFSFSSKFSWNGIITAKFLCAERLGMFGLPLPFIGKSDLPFKPVAMLKCGLPENPHCPPGMQGLVIPRPRNRVCGLADIAAFSA